MSERAPRGAGRAVMGAIAIIAGVLTALVTNAAQSGGGGAYVVAALLVIAGVGLRVEAAILEARTPDTAPAPAGARAADGGS